MMIGVATTNPICASVMFELRFPLTLARQLRSSLIQVKEAQMRTLYFLIYGIQEKLIGAHANGSARNDDIRH